MTWRAFKNEKVWAYGHIFYLKYLQQIWTLYHLNEHEALTLGMANGVRRVLCGRNAYRCGHRAELRQFCFFLSSVKNITVNPPHSCDCSRIV